MQDTPTTEEKRAAIRVAMLQVLAVRRRIDPEMRRRMRKLRLRARAKRKRKSRRVKPIRREEGRIILDTSPFTFNKSPEAKRSVMNPVTRQKVKVKSLSGHPDMRAYKVYRKHYDRWKQRWTAKYESIKARQQQKEQQQRKAAASTHKQNILHEMTMILREGADLGKAEEMVFGEALEAVADEAGADIIFAIRFLQQLQESLVRRQSSNSIDFVIRSLKGTVTALTEAAHKIGRYYGNPSRRLMASAEPSPQRVSAMALRKLLGA